MPDRAGKKGDNTKLRPEFAQGRAVGVGDATSLTRINCCGNEYNPQFVFTSLSSRNTPRQAYDITVQS
jgi:hypothetical protein